jgi:hypothetical protein
MSVITIDPSVSTAAPRRPRGFALPGYAASAARKGHELKLIRQWTADEARAYASAAGHARMARMTPEERREIARRGGLARWKAVP